MFPCLQCNIKRSLQSECKAAAQESEAAAVISTDQPPLSYMRFVVAAPFVSSDRFDDRSCRHCFPTVRDIPPRRICHPPLSESSLGAQAVRWDAIYIPPFPPGAIPVSCRSLSAAAAGAYAISYTWWTRRLMDVCWLQGGWLIYLISSLCPTCVSTPKVHLTAETSVSDLQPRKDFIMI